jgi:squalene-hopene/tetraprenyl-beta-curcumene cyclase
MCHLLKRIKLLVLSILLLKLTVSVAFELPNKKLLQDVLEVKNLAVSNMMKRPHHKGNHWNFTYTMGTSYISQYYLAFKWLGHQSAHLDESKLKKELFKSQLPDGSWQTVKRALPKGEINPTILNYFALKAMGENTQNKRMTKARNWILKEGGIENASFDVKLLLALFNNYLWEDLPLVYRTVLALDEFSQYIDPNFLPISFLRGKQPRKNLGPLFQVHELFKKVPKKLRNLKHPLNEFRYTRLNFVMAVRRSIVDGLIEGQKRNGSWAGYGSSTSLALMVLHSYRLSYLNPQPSTNILGTMMNRGQDFINAHFSRDVRNDENIQKAIKNGLNFIDKVVFQAAPEHRYEGILSDGHIWDTALGIQALTSNDVPPSYMETYGDYLKDTQSKDGGFPFGIDLYSYPDNDDTAEAIIALHSIDPDRYSEDIDKALEWMKSMQSDVDGGFAAFSQNNYGKNCMKFLLSTANFAEVDFFYDVPTADVTGHVLRAFGTLGYTYKNSQAVRRAVGFLREKQVPKADPTMWWGRWGINYIYGTSAALTGLKAVGVPKSEKMVQNALNWLKRRQNRDGGWGEGPESYDNARMAGVGKSTPTQTAWALIPLIDYGEIHDPAVIKGMKYLVKEFKKNGKWTDLASTGTGAPKMIYMDYNSYEFTFPLIAIGRYLKKLKE